MGANEIIIEVPSISETLNCLSAYRLSMDEKNPNAIVKLDDENRKLHISTSDLYNEGIYSIILHAERIP